MVTREIKESATDAIVFVPFILLISAALKYASKASEEAAAEAAEKYGPDDLVTDPRASEYYANMMQWGKMQREVARDLTASIHGLLTRWSLAAATFGFSAIGVAVSYAAGAHAKASCPIGVLSWIDQWHL